MSYIFQQVKYHIVYFRKHLDDDPEFPPIFCTALNVNLFDIEVLDSQNNPVVEAFEGSTAGTTIPHLQPGTYTINEIESSTSNRDQLGDFSTDCAAAALGFLMEELSAIRIQVRQVFTIIDYTIALNMKINQEMHKEMIAIQLH